MRFAATCLIFALTTVAFERGLFAEEEARDAFNAGVDAFEAGDIDTALTHFERAYALRPSYKILFNIAQAQAELGMTEKAIRSFEKYLEDGQDEVSEGRRLKVEEEIARLKAKVGPPPPPPPSTTTAPEVEVATTVTPDSQRNFLFDVAPWVSAGVAAVTLTTGIILGAKSASLNKKLGNNCPDGTCSDAYRGDIDSMEHLAASADVMFVATTLFTAAAVALIVIKKRNDKKDGE